MYKRQFLEELLSYDRQCTSHVPVRRDMPANRLREYTTLMEKCLGITADTAAIEDMIREEAADYFSGSRDAETVARAIQSRVQVYLKEQP